MSRNDLLPRDKDSHVNAGATFGTRHVRIETQSLSDRGHRGRKCHPHLRQRPPRWAMKAFRQLMRALRRSPLLDWPRLRKGKESISHGVVACIAVAASSLRKGKESISHGVVACIAVAASSLRKGKESISHGVVACVAVAVSSLRKGEEVVSHGVVKKGMAPSWGVARGLPLCYLSPLFSRREKRGESGMLLNGFGGCRERL